MLVLLSSRTQTSVRPSRDVVTGFLACPLKKKKKIQWAIYPVNAVIPKTSEWTRTNLSPDRVVSNICPETMLYYLKRTLPPLTMPCRQSQHCLQCKLVDQLTGVVAVPVFASHLTHYQREANKTCEDKSDWKIPSRINATGKSGLIVAEP